MSVDPIALARALINCASVTPASGEVFDVLETALMPLGFTVHRFTLGEPPDGPTENMVAIRGEAGPHFGFAGHLDVVPPGDGWATNPFETVIDNGILTGRGAVDMKSAIAAFVGALSRLEATNGTISLMITGDEEGYATYGTPRIIDWLKERSIKPDMILIGEPTSVDRLGDTVKIGRRGSVNMWIDVPGTQGHVAYPHRADNPIPKLSKVVAALDALRLDDGTDVFPPSNLEFTSVSTPTQASNVIPATSTAQLNIRFNNLQRGADLVRMVEEIAELRHTVAPDLFAGFDPERFPMSSLPALALGAAAYKSDLQHGERVNLALREALFEEGRDLTDPAVLLQIGQPLTLDDLRAGEADVQADYAEGRARGVIGSPHFFVDDEGFFCPTLAIERVEGQLNISFDAEGFDDFMHRCFS